MKKIIQTAIEKKQKALSEYESKQLIASAGIPITKEGLAHSLDDALAFAARFGYPVVLKGCSPTLMHKTELGMVRLNLKNAGEVAQAYTELTGAGLELDGVLVQEMVRGGREFVIGLTRDPQFGPCVMFGMGGIYTEALKDVTFRVAPITEDDAAEMLDEIKMKSLLGEFRGSPAVDRQSLIKSLVAIGTIGMEHDEIAEIDINPVVISGSNPVVVDALVILKT